MIGVLKPERLALYNYGPGAEARLLTQGFAAIGMFLDSLHPGTSFTLWRRWSEQDRGAWGRYAVASRSGPLELEIAAQCTRDVRDLPGFEPPAAGVSALRFALAGGRDASTPQSLLARFVFASDSDPGPAGFVVASPNPGQIDAYLDALQSGRALPRRAGDTFGILGGLLSTGERGRDLLIDPAALQAEQVHVAVFATRPVTLTRLTLALPSTDATGCNEAARSRLQHLAASATAPYVAPITVLRWAREVGPGEPLEVVLSRPARHVRTVVRRQDGTVVARSEFDNTDRLVINLAQPGQYGVEVLISQAGTDAMIAIPIYPRVRP
jgi:hypothetical protein